MTLPLDGIKVLDLTRLLPGPFCSQVLADFGAEVIKIEDTEMGDYSRWMPPLAGHSSVLFYAVNRNKQSVRLNLKKEAGKEIFYKLVAQSDVLLEGFRPGVMEKLGLGYDQLSQQNPGLVYCAISGYGQSGPMRDRAGHDINYLNLAGISALTGHKNELPSVPGVQIADLGGGAQWAVIAVLLALKAREKTGRGQFCDVAMLDGVLSWQAMMLADFGVTGRCPARGSELLNGGYAFYKIYPTSDGRFVSLGALEAKFWSEFCSKIGHEEYIALQFDVSAQEWIISALTELFRQRTLEEWVEFFAECDICFSPVREYDELLTDPHIQAREMLVKTEINNQELLLTGIPVKLSDTPGIIEKRFPAWGEHTDRILAELGYSSAEINALKEQGVI